jgi:hypothetical protein
MGKRCVAANCDSTHKDGVSLFTFPKDAHVRARWNKQIRKTRADWHSPTPYSCICSKHFTEDCFETQSLLSDKLGIKRKQLLKPEAVPTIFTPADEMKTKKTRVSSALRKRECSMILSAASPPTVVDDDSLSKETQTEVECNDKNVQVDIKPQRKTKCVQADPIKKDVGIQCNISPMMYEVEVQCGDGLLQPHETSQYELFNEIDDTDSEVSIDEMDGVDFDVGDLLEVDGDDESDGSSSFSDDELEHEMYENDVYIVF